jgi:tryptophan synthase alpha chain
MGYYNPILRYGLQAYASAASSAGARGAIVCDLTPEEADGWIEASREHQLDTIFLAAPTSTQRRLDIIAQRSSGFVYAVSRTGVTGTMDTVPPEALGLVRQIKERTDTPVCIGFGISRPDHVKTVCEVADGAVVGSAIVNLIHQTWQNGAGAAKLTSAVRELKAATNL